MSSDDDYDEMMMSMKLLECPECNGVFDSDDKMVDVDGVRRCIYCAPQELADALRELLQGGDVSGASELLGDTGAGVRLPASEVTELLRLIMSIDLFRASNASNKAEECRSMLEELGLRDNTKSPDVRTQIDKTDKYLDQVKFWDTVLDSLNQGMLPPAMDSDSDDEPQGLPVGFFLQALHIIMRTKYDDNAASECQEMIRLLRNNAGQLSGEEQQKMAKVEEMLEKLKAGNLL